MDDRGYSCTLCNRFAASSMDSVLRHIGRIHAHQPDFRVVCRINSCPKTYTNYHSFRKHLRRKHTVALLSGSQSHEPSSNNFVFDEDIEHSQSSPIWNQESAACFVLKTKEVQQMPQVAVNGFLSDITMLVENSVNSLSTDVRTTLEQNDVVVGDIVGLERVLESEELRKPFDGLGSEYLQRKAFHSLGLVVSNILLK